MIGVHFGFSLVVAPESYECVVLCSVSFFENKPMELGSNRAGEFCTEQIWGEVVNECVGEAVECNREKRRILSRTK